MRFAFGSAVAFHDADLSREERGMLALAVTVLILVAPFG
jgi:hypothetical protein